MSCEACEEVQSHPDLAPGDYFVRVGAANVQIVGCPEHVGELLEVYRFGHKARQP